MEQLGWTDPIEGDVEVVADPELLKSLINDSLTDVGDTIDDITRMVESKLQESKRL